MSSRPSISCLNHSTGRWLLLHIIWVYLLGLLSPLTAQTTRGESRRQPCDTSVAHGAARRLFSPASSEPLWATCPYSHNVIHGRRVGTLWQQNSPTPELKKTTAQLSLCFSHRNARIKGTERKLKDTLVCSRKNQRLILKTKLIKENTAWRKAELRWKRSCNMSQRSPSEYIFF